MLCAERDHDGIVGSSSLQLKVEAAAETLTQSESPRAIDAIAEGGMQDELHPAGLIEESLHHERLLRGKCTEGFVNIRVVGGNLLGGGGWECDADDCAWLFLDTSKNGSRRWCDMKQCGNRAKARRFHAKHSE